MEEQLQDEKNKMQKEIQQLKDLLAQTSGGLQNDLIKKEDEINKLNKKIQEMEKDIIKLKKEK